MLKKILWLFIFLSHLQALDLQTKVSNDLHFSYYEDETSNLGINKIHSLPMSSWNLSKNNNFKHSSSSFWLRLEIVNRSEYNKWILCSKKRLNYLDVYLLEKNKVVYESHVGTKVDYRNSDIPHRYFLFPLHLQKKHNYVLYIRLASISIIRFDITLCEEQAFFHRDTQELAYQVFFYGCFFIIIIFNIVIGVFTWNIKYLHYVLYFTAVSVFFLLQEGFVREYEIHSLDNELHIFSILSKWLFFYLFVYYLLDVKTHFLRMKHFFHFFIITLPTISALYIVGLVSFRNNIKLFMLSILFLGCTLPWMIWKMRHKNRGVIYFGLGWLSLCLAAIANILLTEGVISNRIWNDNIYKSVIIFEGIIFSLALADRVNQEKEDKLRVQEELYTYQEQEKQRLQTIVDEKTAQLQDAIIETEKASKAKSEFLALMSHELRTPLNAILGFSYMLQQDEDLCAKKRKNLGVIYQSGEHLLNVINMVLDLSKIEAKHMELQLQNTDLQELLQDVCNIFSFKAQQKNLQFIFDGDDIAHCILCDKTKLRQILFNVLSNALKFTDSGSIYFQVHCKQLSTENVRLFFEVRDTGVGIAPHEIPKVFKPFEQTQAGQQQKGGTGLGMPISLKFAQLMGGDISIHSTPLKGTTVKIDIPAAVTQNKVQYNFAAHPTLYKKSQLTIVIADDEEVNRLLLKQVLKPFAFQIYEACTGEQAIDLWKKYKPHLILMDMCMPKLDGYKASKHIKKLDRKIVIIAATASAFQEDKESMFAAGCDDILIKPISPLHLLETMKKYLNVQYAYKETPKQNTPVPSIMNSLSVEQKQQLKQAAIEAEIDRIYDVIQKISPEHSETITILNELIENFDYEKIIELVDKSTL